jgi:hypothetical protein
MSGVRKSSVPAVHIAHPSNFHNMTNTDERKVEKGWAMFEEDCQGNGFDSVVMQKF